MSADITWTGRYSAQERAEDRWGITALPEPEQARHDRLMASIRRLEKAEHAEHADRVAREEPRDMYRWRKKYNAHLKKQLRDMCRTCKGTGEITVSDGHGCVDFDACPRCSWFEPYTNDYPTADDETMETPF